MKSIKIFEKDYDGESLYDLGRDVNESLEPRFNPVVDSIPTDDLGFQIGTFKVNIEWVDDETPDVKLITAESARQMRGDSLSNFIEKDMQEFIVYLNKKIEEATKNGYWSLSLFYQYYYVSPDPVISKLSTIQLNILMEYLKENGYDVSMMLDYILKISWAPKIEEPTVKESHERFKFWWK